MKQFLDTEFIEHAGGIQIVSIGIYTPETNKSLYIESTSFDHRLADDWVKKNVLQKLSYVDEFAFPGEAVAYNGCYWNDDDSGYYGASPESQIGEHILRYLESDPDPEFYAYFASYDWVVFARLFGRLIQKPEKFPMWVIDLKQMMWERGLTKEWKRDNCPDPEGAHNALIDAKWNYKLYNKIIEHKLADV